MPRFSNSPREKTRRMSTRRRGCRGRVAVVKEESRMGNEDGRRAARRNPARLAFRSRTVHRRASCDRLGWSVTAARRQSARSAGSTHALPQPPVAPKEQEAWRTSHPPVEALRSGHDRAPPRPPSASGARLPRGADGTHRRGAAARAGLYGPDRRGKDRRHRVPEVRCARQDAPPPRGHGRPADPAKRPTSPGSRRLPA